MMPGEGLRDADLGSPAGDRDAAGADEGSSPAVSPTLSASQIRSLAAGLGIRPSRSRGQNFVVDAGTVHKVVRRSGVGPDDHVIEVGPGLGSLTLALLPHTGRVTAIEVDPALAAALPDIVRRHAPGTADRLHVVHSDALQVTEVAGPPPTALVANLPYNVAVPVVLTFLERFPSLRRVLVMVQLEVAERLAAEPGSRVYGVPSVKAAWYAEVRLTDRVGRGVFWPVPRVDSGLVELRRRAAPATAARRADVFACVDAAFAQRRKTLRAALAGWAGSPQRAEQVLRAAGVDPGIRGERLRIEEFAAIAAHRSA